MIITNEKIEVSFQMMNSAGMTRGCQFGIPVNQSNKFAGLRWKNFIEMTDEDFDKIEEYFLLKTK